MNGRHFLEVLSNHYKSVLSNSELKYVYFNSVSLYLQSNYTTHRYLSHSYALLKIALLIHAINGSLLLLFNNCWQTFHPASQSINV